MGSPKDALHPKDSKNPAYYLEANLLDGALADRFFLIINIPSYFDRIDLSKIINASEQNNYEFLLVPPNGKPTEIHAKLIEIGIDNKKSVIKTKFWFENFSTTPLSLAEIAEYLEQILPADKSEIKTSEAPLLLMNIQRRSKRFPI